MNYTVEYRVIYGDTDNMGVAYYSNYFRWFEIGRTEYFRWIGIPYTKIEEGYFLPVTQAYCKYHKSVQYDEVIVIDTSIRELGKASITFYYNIILKNNNSRLASGFTQHAFMDKNGKIIRVPQFVYKRVNEFISLKD